MSEGIKNFLCDIKLQCYYEIFVTKGYDSESDIIGLDVADLDALLITDESHRTIILKAAKCHLPSPEHRLQDWLRKIGLDYYFENFVACELIDLNQISRLNLPDESAYDDLEITLPGHKKRLERAVRQLNKRHRCLDVPLKCGYWGRPSALQEAKYDFLCVTAEISSTKPQQHRRVSQSIEFMVDSGSDVVTLKEEVLDQLDLELLGTIRSKGVHASKEKKLYKARLRIGSEEIETEVMPESYDSLGSRVIRHFRHYIDGGKHVWLKGNYSDSTTADTFSGITQRDECIPNSVTDKDEGSSVSHS